MWKLVSMKPPTRQKTTMFSALWVNGFFDVMHAVAPNYDMNISISNDNILSLYTEAEEVLLSIAT